jgi:hypothetical protein
MTMPDQRTRHVVSLSIVSCAPLMLFIAVPGLALSVVLVVVSGIALYYWIPLAAEFTQTVPDAMRGQAVGLLTSMMRVTQGGAILIFGLVAERAVSSTVIAASGVIGTAMVIGLSLAWVWANRPGAITVTPRTTPGDSVS